LTLPGNGTLIVDSCRGVVKGWFPKQRALFKELFDNQIKINYCIL
jgi:hypothetical protein